MQQSYYCLEAAPLLRIYCEAMENGLSKSGANRIIKLTVLTVITHSLLPLALFLVAFLVVPSFAARSRELGVEISRLTAFVFNLSSFIRWHQYFCILIFGFAIIIDAVICFSLFRFRKKTAIHLWSGSIILIEFVLAALCVLALLLSLYRMSNAPLLCPISGL